MRKVSSIIIGIVIAASCIPWLRHQRFFSVLVGITAVALIGLIVFGWLHTLSAWSKRKRQQPNSARSGWWSPKILNLLLGAVLISLFVPMVAQFMTKTSSVYKLAVATAHGAPQFRETLGLPIREAWYSEGEIDSGKAELTIPVEGSKRKGNLRTLAIKEDGHWKLTSLNLELSQPDEHIDLLRLETK